jgi:hypothetical protein
MYMLVTNIRIYNMYASSLCMKSYECLHPGHLSPSSIQQTFEVQTLCIIAMISQRKNYMDIFETDITVRPTICVSVSY